MTTRPPDHDRIGELLLRWEELAERGRVLTAEQQCARCPELTEALRSRIEALRAFDAMLPGHEAPSPPDAPPGVLP